MNDQSFDNQFQPVELNPEMPFESLKHSVLELERQIENEAYVDLDGNGALESVVQRVDSNGDGIPDAMRILGDGIAPSVQPYDPAVWESGTTALDAADPFDTTSTP